LNDEYPALVKIALPMVMPFAIYAKQVVFMRSKLFCHGRDFNQTLITNKP